MLHKESTLPLWAQEKLNDLRLELEFSKEKCENLQKAHDILKGKEWFKLTGPNPTDTDEYINLWTLTDHSPFCICRLQRGDTLLVGRARKYDEI